VIVYAVVDDSLSRHLLGDSIDVFVRRKDAERFIEEREAVAPWRHCSGSPPAVAHGVRIGLDSFGSGAAGNLSGCWRSTPDSPRPPIDDAREGAGESLGPSRRPASPTCSCNQNSTGSYNRGRRGTR
jgi:hypothetical protein